MAHFVFVQFTDPQLVGFLSELVATLQGKPPNVPVHITVRGPYRSIPPRELLEDLWSELRGNGVRITGVGQFRTPKGAIVYIGAESSAFREIWWKPDFPLKDYGVTPHISIYETRRIRNAKLVSGALGEERINIRTLGVRLSMYTARQADLLTPLEFASDEQSRAPTDYGTLDCAATLARMKAFKASHPELDL